MSSELYIPNIIGKPGTEFYRHSETWRRRSEASKKKAAKYWSDPKNHERVDTKQAKPVAAYLLDGTFVGWWPSSRKAALALFPSEELRIAERNVRACRQGKLGKWAKKQHKGFMFRDWTGDTSDIEPYKRARKTQKRGYHRDNSNLKKPCTVDYGDGDPIRFDSLKELAAAIHGTRAGVWLAMKEGRKYKGKTIKFIKGEKK